MRGGHVGLPDDGRERSLAVAYRVLGDVAVLDADGNPVETLTGKLTSVLALLLLRAEAVVPEAKLIEAGDWGSAGNPATQVQKAVSAIRNKVLRRAGQPAEIETVWGIGYRLTVAAEALDSAAFLRAVKDADEGPTPQRIASLRRALAVWSGTRPLANLPDELCTDDGPFAGDVTRL